MANLIFYLFIGTGGYGFLFVLWLVVMLIWYFIKEAKEKKEIERIHKEAIEASQKWEEYKKQILIDTNCLIKNEEKE